MPIYEFEAKRPQIANSSYVHPQAVLIGAVEIGEYCYIGAGAVIRGDYGKIVVGNCSAIEDNCVVHTEPESIAIIEDKVLIGHGAIVHGPCLIKQEVTVGMGAIVSTGCEIGPRSLLAAGSVLTPGKIVPEGKLAAGNPVRTLNELEERLLDYNRMGTRLYSELCGRYQQSLKLISD